MKEGEKKEENKVSRNNQRKETKKERKNKAKKKNKAEQSGPGRSQTFTNCVSVMTARKSNATPTGQQVQMLKKLLCVSCSAAPCKTKQGTSTSGERRRKRKKASKQASKQSPTEGKIV